MQKIEGQGKTSTGQSHGNLPPAKEATAIAWKEFYDDPIRPWKVQNHPLTLQHD